MIVYFISRRKYDYVSFHRPNAIQIERGDDHLDY